MGLTSRIYWVNLFQHSGYPSCICNLLIWQTGCSHQRSRIPLILEIWAKITQPQTASHCSHHRLDFWAFLKDSVGLLDVEVALRETERERGREKEGESGSETGKDKERNFLPPCPTDPGAGERLNESERERRRKQSYGNIGQ